MGNILEAIMGYAFISQYMKEVGLKDFMEIANFLENTLMEIMIEDNEEDHEEAETKAAGPQTFNMTEGAVKKMAMMVTQGILDKMKTMEEKMEELNTTHDATKQTMIMGFADTERSLEAAH
eukprot:560857-Heterocapsa_arctica.AAC.1